MKINRKYSNEGVKGRSGGYQHWGCTPPKSRVPLLPRNMNKSFIKRFIDWWK